MLFQSPIQVGLELTDTEIRLLKIKHAHPNFHIENLSHAPLPSDAIVHGKIQQFDRVIAALEPLVQQSNSRGAKTAIALPSHSVISRRIQLTDELTDEECAAEIKMNLKNYFPSVQDELSFDFIKLRQEGSLELFITAARTELVESYKQVATHANLNVKTIDVDLYALVRAVFMATPSRTLAILHIQERFTYFVVLHEQQIIYQQHWLNTRDVNELVVHIKRQLEIVYSIQDEIQIHQLVLIALRADTIQLTHLFKIEFNIEIIPIQSFKRTTFSPSIQPNNVNNLLPRMMVSYGLAIRRIAHD